jgi:transcriptional regulator with XRE-family HTH domain
MDHPEKPAKRKPQGHTHDERAAFGRRLASARKLKGLTIQGVADALTQKGYEITKGAVGHWETGTNLPDALWLSRLAKLYGTTLDALVWDESLSPAAIQVAVEYDHLPEQKQRDWRVLWLGFMTGHAPGGELLPPAPDRDGEPAGRQQSTDSRRTDDA